MWFRLHNVVLDCPEVYFCVCYMPQKKDFTHLQRDTPTAICPYECLQKDILEFQCKGAQILVCGDFNARTAEEPDFLRTEELQSFLPTAPDDDELPDYIPDRRNCDKATPGSQTWGLELLGLCQQNNLLILNGRTPGDEYGQYTFESARGHSTIDYFIASAKCMAAAQSLHVHQEASRYGSDHNLLQLHLACEQLSSAPTHPPSATPATRVRYDSQRAEAYQMALASELQQHFVPFIHHELDVDLLSDNLIECLTSAAKQTMPHARTHVVHSRKQQPWFNGTCKQALTRKEAVYKNLHSTVDQKKAAEKIFRSVTDRVKEAWKRQRNVELCEMAAKDATQFWRVFKTPHSNACPVELSVQFEAFRTLMGAGPLPAPDTPAAPGVFTPDSNNASLNANITSDELCSCIKRLKRGKSPGIDGILADMIKDGGDLVQECLLWLFNCMLASHFPERLSVGLITAVYKSGDKFDMSNYRGITVGSVIAKLFAMILEQRLSTWAEEHAVKAKGQAGFRKDFRTTDNIFILRSLIDKQRQTRQKGKMGKLYCCFVDFRKAFDTVPRAVLWQVLEELGVRGRILDIIKSLYAHDSAAVRSPQGLSDIFRCLMGVKQGCPLSPTLFGLYVDALEKHLLGTADIDAPTLRGVLVPLLLYADDLILMSTSEAGLQKQLDALANFCEQRQLTVNLSKTKIVVFESQQSQVVDFVLNDAVVERVESYKYLGFTLHATKDMTFGTKLLVATAQKAVYAMQRRCAFLGIRDPEMQCKLFDILVLPILSYAVEVWGVKPKVAEAAELLHRNFLKRVLGIRKSTANEIVLAELGRFPLQIHFWQRILQYHHRILKLDNTRLVTLAILEGFCFVDQGFTCNAVCPFWHHHVALFLQNHSTTVFLNFDIAAIVDKAKQQYIEHYNTQTALVTLCSYRTLQPEYKYAEYLSMVVCMANRVLLTRFRCGCHGLHIDTGRWVGLDRKDRLCQVCNSGQDVEDEHHFLFDCPAYSYIRLKHMHVFEQVCTVPEFLARCEPNACAGFLRDCFDCRKCILSD